MNAGVTRTGDEVRRARVGFRLFFFLTAIVALLGVVVALIRRRRLSGLLRRQTHLREHRGVAGIVPDLGEQSSEILTEAGLSADEIAALRAAGAVGGS